MNQSNLAIGSHMLGLGNHEKGTGYQLSKLTKQPLALVAAVFVIAGAAIIVLNIINYFQNGRFGTFSVFGLFSILLGLWFYIRGRNRSLKMTGNSSLRVISCI
jgi:hypothetical protein